MAGACTSLLRPRTGGAHFCTQAERARPVAIGAARGGRLYVPRNSSSMSLLPLRLGAGAVLDGRTLVARENVQKVQASPSGIGSGSDDIKEEANGLRRIGWISFWSQLALSIVSGIVLFFTATTASQGGFPKLPVFFNLAGVVTGFISTFLAFGKTRVARRVLVDSEKYSKSKVAAGVLGSIRLNLLGMGATIVGLQSTVGGLVGKALTSSSAGAYNVQAASSAPAALDVFAVQASTNTILLHFIAILFSNWTLRVLNKDVSPPAPATS